MSELITFLEEVALLLIAGLGALIIDVYRRIVAHSLLIVEITTKLDSGDKRFAELREDIKGARGELHDMRGDVSRILGILEKRKD